MSAKVFAAVFLVAIVAQVNGACLCGFGEGKDMCGGPKCQPMVIRPAPLPKLKMEDLCKPRVVCKQIGGLPALRPIGDLCSCRQSIVVPALVPRPSCSCSSCSGSGSSSHSHSTSGSSSYAYGGSSSSGGSNIIDVISSNPIVYSQSSGASSDYNEDSDGSSHSQSASYGQVADPVSLSLAYKMQKKACGGISEDKLNFGFQKLPIDGSKAVVVKNVPEENLYKLNGAIVELKPISCGKVSKSIDEEALEDLAAAELEDEAVEEESSGGVKKLTYGDIGYDLAKLKAPKMVAVEGVVDTNPQEMVESSDCNDCNDGFVPGRMTINNIPRREIYVPSEAGPSDCDDSEELGLPAKYVSSFSTSSSSSSNHRQHHHQQHTSYY